ncbi:porin [bacterium]|nr:porin [bacterium]
MKMENPVRRKISSLFALLALALSIPGAQAAEEGGITGPLGSRYYLEDGFHFDSPAKGLKFKINGRIAYDIGEIFADSELQEAFPDLDGRHSDFRTLQLSIHGWFRKAVEYKVSIDFANVRQVKDNWIRFPSVPVLRHFRIGNMKEPFSLEELTSSRFRTFMEPSLPTYALAPGRDIGVFTGNTAKGERVTWTAGLFLNTGSLSTVGDTKDQISEASGGNLTARITGLPWYTDGGRRLFHVGAAYSRQFRSDETGTALTFPESRLVDDKLVDTGDFSTDGNDLVGLEAALLRGPLSLQGEFMLIAVNGSGNPLFWGFYGYGSWFLTGEHREYDTSKGVFREVKPKRGPPWKKSWGAWELALRLSYIDLNDGNLSGGKERNITAGLNWYLTERYRFMFNYINVRVTDRANPPAVDDGREQTYAARFAYWF